jgi:uncharacterized membrane protein YqiK
MDPEIQAKVDEIVAEVTSKFAAEKQVAIDSVKAEADATIAAIKAEADATIAAAKKEGQVELLLVLKSSFGLV